MTNDKLIEHFVLCAARVFIVENNRYDQRPYLFLNQFYTKNLIGESINLKFNLRENLNQIKRYFNELTLNYAYVVTVSAGTWYFLFFTQQEVNHLDPLVSKLKFGIDLHKHRLSPKFVEKIVIDGYQSKSINSSNSMEKIKKLFLGNSSS